MNGIITISDGIATMENGNLTDVNTVDANSMNSTILTTTTPVLSFVTKARWYSTELLVTFKAMPTAAFNTFT